jgi:hypothetical protein
MDALITVLIIAAAGAGWIFVQRRRRETARIAAAFGANIHPKTLAALGRDPKRELEQDGLWIKEHERTLAERFRGQWIAVVRKEVVAIGSTADEAWRAASAGRPARPPFVRRIA